MSADESLSKGIEAARRGAWAEAEAHCREALWAAPGHFIAQMILADVLAAAGKMDEALRAYGVAAHMNPGHSVPFTRMATLGFRLHHGPPVPPRVSMPGRPRIQMTSLGANGRFGNQLLQYGFVRLYAKEFELSAEFPDWIGRDFYDLDDPVPSAQLRAVGETQADLFGSLNRRTPQVFADVDINGYFCGPTSAWGPRASEFRRLFTPGTKVTPSLDRALGVLRGAGATLVALHMRRADFGYGRFWIAPFSWYLAWLREIWPTLDRPVLYIATDDKSVLADFAEFAPWDDARLGVSIPGAEFLIDHHVLRHADRLAISNSTFSFSAAMLNERAAAFVRPDPDRQMLIPFVPWDAPVLLDAKSEVNDLTAAQRHMLSILFQTDASVLHIGRFCSPWTNAAREVHPMMRIAEAEPSVSLDAWRRARGNTHLQHLVVEDCRLFDEIFAGAAETLRHSRVDIIHFRVNDGEAPPDVVPLRNHHYAIFQASEKSPAYIDPAAPLGPGAYVAFQERILPLVTGIKSEGIDIPAQCAAHNIVVRGVLHIGAHEGKEISTYDTVKASRVVFVEANPDVYERLDRAMLARPNVMTVHRAISDSSGTVLFHIADFDQSGSLLRMAGHRDIYPEIWQVEAIKVKSTTLDMLLSELKLDPAEFNFLNVDVQGAEGMVLRGATEVLKHISAVNIEVNFAELYSGCAQIEEIDSLMEASGLFRVATISPFHRTWGDAFYIRKQ